MYMKTVLITGGTGLVGRALVRHFVASGLSVIVCSRNPGRQTPQSFVRYSYWDPAKGILDETAISEADYIVNLAGAGVVDHKWTDAYRETIRESRVQSGRLIVEALKNKSHHVKAVVNASAIGWYGPDRTGRQTPFREEDPSSNDFLGETCRAWEASIDLVGASGIRLIKLRFGIVLAQEGGALAEFIRPLRFGLAAVIGNGKQVMSWIGREDLCRMISFALLESEISGVYNAVSPHPVTNEELNRTLAGLMRGRFYLKMHVPAFVIRLMLGSRSVEVLKSTTVSAEKIRSAGFVFRYPELEKALSAELSLKS